MSILSDIGILEKLYDKEITLTPLLYDHIQPSSVDLTLDEKIKVPKDFPEKLHIYDTKIEEVFEDASLCKYELKPGAFVIGQIKETISLSKRYAGNIQNRRSVVQLGINVNLLTYINPGYSGKLPIVIKNTGKFIIELVPGMRICQLVIYDVTPESRLDYSIKEDAKYHKETEISLPKLHKDKEFKEYLESKNKKPGDKIDRSELMLFFEKRLQDKSVNTLDELTTDERKELGLE